MMIIKNIAILFAALSIGGIFVILFAIARCGRGVIGRVFKIAITAAALCLAFFASAYSALWFWGIVIGYVLGLFALSLCIVSGNADRACNR